MTADRGLRLGIDVGGTFTDVVVVGAGAPARGKVPSTPDDPTEGVLAAVDLEVDAVHRGPGAVREVEDGPQAPDLEQRRAQWR